MMEVRETLPFPYKYIGVFFPGLLQYMHESSNYLFFVLTIIKDHDKIYQSHTDEKIIAKHGNTVILPGLLSFASERATLIL